MRKRRAIIYDDEQIIVSMLEIFFAKRGYEVLAFSEPVVCPVFRNNERHCPNEKLCADVMVADFKMPHMTGIELFELQKARGCRLDVRNKALISGYVDDAEIGEFIRSGGTFFSKPFRLSDMALWVEECQRNVPLSREIGVPRKERREPVLIKFSCSLPSQNRRIDGIVTDISESGLCIKIGCDLQDRQLFIVDSDLPLSCREATVRWTRKLADKSVIAGLSCN